VSRLKNKMFNSHLTSEVQMPHRFVAEKNLLPIKHYIRTDLIPSRKKPFSHRQQT